jgi:hypothetical protein
MMEAAWQELVLMVFLAYGRTVLKPVPDGRAAGSR